MIFLTQIVEYVIIKANMSRI